MKKYIYSIIGCFVAVSFWFIESLVHYYIFEEGVFKIIPSRINELWMRTALAYLTIFFGIFADFHTRKMLKKEKQLEALKIYRTTVLATHQILNNLLNQMQLFKIQLLRDNNVDKKTIDRYDGALKDASGLIEKLSSIEEISKENIEESVRPQ
jgi:hypothetical protein